MAKVIKENVGGLNVINKYQELMKASTAEDSVYIKLKETVTDFVTTAEMLTEKEKAEIVSAALSGIATNITTHAMDVALKISTEERDAPYALTKVRVDTELTDAQRKKLEDEEDLTKAQIAKMEADAANSAINGWQIQANIWRDTGFNVSGMDTDTLILPHTGTISDYGAKHEAIRMGQAGVYDKWASTVRANGLVTINQNQDGMLTSNTADSVGMAYSQILVADRQRLAFDDNMRQHVLNSSSAMLGTMIGAATFDTAAAYDPYLTKWFNAADYLNTNHNEAAGAIVISAWPALWTTAPFTITGTGTNIIGKNLTVKLVGQENTIYVTDDVYVVDQDGNISITVSQAMLDSITGIGEVIVSVSTIDSRGIRIASTNPYTIA